MDVDIWKQIQLREQLFCVTEWDGWGLEWGGDSQEDTWWFWYWLDLWWILIGLIVIDEGIFIKL